MVVERSLILFSHRLRLTSELSLNAWLDAFSASSSAENYVWVKYKKTFYQAHTYRQTLHTVHYTHTTYNMHKKFYANIHTTLKCTSTQPHTNVHTTQTHTLLVLSQAQHTLHKYTCTHTHTHTHTLNPPNQPHTHAHPLSGCLALDGHHFKLLHK